MSEGKIFRHMKDGEMDYNDYLLREPWLRSSCRTVTKAINDDTICIYVASCIFVKNDARKVVPLLDLGESADSRTAIVSTYHCSKVIAIVRMRPEKFRP